MRILNPQTRGVPRVPCVPKLVKAFNFGAFNDGTQIALNRNTWSMAHKRCSKDGSTSKQHLPTLTGGLLASPGARTRVLLTAKTGRGVSVE